MTGGLADLFYGMGEGLAEWLITAPGGEQILLQMAYYDRDRTPVDMDIGPVLDLQDVLGSKVCALASRVEPRDYADTAAALERYRPAQLIGFAKRLDPGLTDRDFADAGLALRRTQRPAVRPRPGSARSRSPGSGSASRPGPAPDGRKPRGVHD